MKDYSTTVTGISSELLQDILDIGNNDADILKTYIEFSTLYEEIKILFIHKNKKSFLSNNDRLRMFKYDFANKCGVLLSVTDETDKNPRVIKSVGNESVLAEKNWL